MADCYPAAILSGESAERHLLQSNPDASKVHSVGAVSQKCEALGAEMSGAWVEVVRHCGPMHRMGVPP